MVIIWWPSFNAEYIYIFKKFTFKRLNYYTKPENNKISAFSNNVDIKSW